LETITHAIFDAEGGENGKWQELSSAERAAKRKKKKKEPDRKKGSELCFTDHVL